AVRVDAEERVVAVSRADEHEVGRPLRRRATARGEQQDRGRGSERNPSSHSRQRMARTILPWWAPLLSSSCAASASPSGSTRSITGFQSALPTARRKPAKSTGDPRVV